MRAEFFKLQAVSLLQINHQGIIQNCSFKGLRIYFIDLCEDCLSDQRPEGGTHRGKTHKIYQGKWTGQFIQIFDLPSQGWHKLTAFWTNPYDELK